MVHLGCCMCAYMPCGIWVGFIFCVSCFVGWTCGGVLSWQLPWLIPQRQTSSWSSSSATYCQRCAITVSDIDILVHVLADSRAFDTPSLHVGVLGMLNASVLLHETCIVGSLLQYTFVCFVGWTCGGARRQRQTLSWSSCSATYCQR
jgi:hypothetical protein